MIFNLCIQFATSENMNKNNHSKPHSYIVYKITQIFE